MEFLGGILRFVASIPFIVLCLFLMMVLVVLGTLAQVDIGAFAAQKVYFNSFVVWEKAGSFSIPVFPGGLTIGLMWLVSLLATSVVRFKWYRQNIGFLLAHLGIVLLIAGQGLTQILSEESMMSIEQGQTSNFAEVSRDFEIAIETSNKSAEVQLTSFPSSTIYDRAVLSAGSLPFDISIRKYWPNSTIRPRQSGGNAIVSQGAGVNATVIQMPVTQKDDEQNAPSVVADIRQGGSSIGTWLLSTRIEDPQRIEAGGQSFLISLRARRRYFPFSITLKKFTHDIYPGTDIPKNFASAVKVEFPDAGESRDALIYMNHPLRIGGYTFYQASFGKNDTLSVFQVVKNPARLTPYISCIIVTIGLLMKFLSTLFAKPKRGIL